MELRNQAVALFGSKDSKLRFLKIMRDIERNLAAGGCPGRAGGGAHLSRNCRCASALSEVKVGWGCATDLLPPTMSIRSQLNTTTVDMLRSMFGRILIGRACLTNTPLQSGKPIFSRSCTN